jgi:hypothetical protein
MSVLYLGNTQLQASEIETKGVNLLENLRLRVFRLSPTRSRDGISCDAGGAFVGTVPLLNRIRLNSATREQWIARPEAELNEKLTLLYDMPVDVASKIGGMETIARALNEGKLALAKIATVQLRFPDPQARSSLKGDNRADRVALAVELYCSALLKADDDWDEKHPRTGTKPNPGWFAEKPEEPKLPSKPGWPVPAANGKAKAWIAEVAKKIIPKAGRLLLDGVPVVDAISAFVGTLKPTDLNGGEDRLVAQMRTNFDPPKTLEELQQAPTENLLGYEQHHIVEQTDDNVAKDIDQISSRLEKFGRDMIDDPSNIVWVPRLKHEQISGYYSSKPVGSPSTVRASLAQLDFATQRAAGLEALSRYGVLK